MAQIHNFTDLIDARLNVKVCFLLRSVLTLRLLAANKVSRHEESVIIPHCSVNDNLIIRNYDTIAVIVAPIEPLLNILSDSIDAQNLRRQIKITVNFPIPYIFRQQDIAGIDMRASASQQYLIKREPFRMYMAYAKHAFAVKLTDSLIQHFHRVAKQRLIVAIDKHMSPAHVIHKRPRQVTAERTVHCRLSKVVIQPKQLVHNVILTFQGGHRQMELFINRVPYMVSQYRRVAV